MKSSLVFYSILTSIIILSSITIFTSEVYGLKSHGTKNPIINSKNICGDKICSEPKTMKEKIEVYLSSLFEGSSSPFQQGRFQIGGMGGLFQQSINSNLMDEELGEPLDSSNKISDLHFKNEE